MTRFIRIKFLLRDSATILASEANRQVVAALKVKDQKWEEGLNQVAGCSVLTSVPCPDGTGMAMVAMLLRLCACASHPSLQRRQGEWATHPGGEVLGWPGPWCPLSSLEIMFLRPPGIRTDGEGGNVGPNNCSLLIQAGCIPVRYPQPLSCGV